MGSALPVAGRRKSLKCSVSTVNGAEPVCSESRLVLSAPITDFLPEAVPPAMAIKMQREEDIAVAGRLSIGKTETRRRR